MFLNLLLLSGVLAATEWNLCPTHATISQLRQCLIDNQATSRIHIKQGRITIYIKDDEEGCPTADVVRNCMEQVYSRKPFSLINLDELSQLDEKFCQTFYHQARPRVDEKWETDRSESERESDSDSTAGEFYYMRYANNNASNSNDKNILLAVNTPHIYDEISLYFRHFYMSQR